MRTLVRVTKQDIKTGERMSTRMCPVAIALKRVVGSRDVLVSHNTVDVYNPKIWIYEQFLLPESASRFIDKFDNEKPVNPFNFYLKD